jgi:hypothetical protein
MLYILTVERVNVDAIQTVRTNCSILLSVDAIHTNISHTHRDKPPSYGKPQALVA